MPTPSDASPGAWVVSALVHAVMSAAPLPHYPDIPPPATTSTTSTSTSATTAPASSSTAPSPGPLVRVSVYNPVRTYLKHLLRTSFHVDFGDEDVSSDCVPDAEATRTYDFVLTPRADGRPLCSTVGVEYFAFRAPAASVRAAVEGLLTVLPAGARRWVMSSGVLLVEAAQP